MKKSNYGYIALLLLIVHNGLAQNYTWKKGDKFISQVSVYGTLGTSSVSNKPGSREAPSTWTDANGGLWLFGGYGFDATSNFGFLSDLWKYSVQTNEWTWVKGDNVKDLIGNYGSIGTPASSNKPGAREAAATWVDNAGNFWLFGGFGHDAYGNVGQLNDLWMYTVSTNEWIWMNGSDTYIQNGNYGTKLLMSPAIQPGGRYSPVTWTDQSGNFWLYGGFGYDGVNGVPGYLNDLWKFNYSNYQWTWMGGDTIANKYGNYGTQNTADPANQPGARRFSASWLDVTGNFWMYGGDGYASAGSFGYLDDLWLYDVPSNQWTWMKGNQGINQLGNYGTLTVSNPANNPGSRMGSITWKDKTGYLWMLGGFGFASTNTSNFLNDLWKFDFTTYEWIWMKGSSIGAQSGLYGTQGVSSPTNMPGARYAGGNWCDAASNLWLFGGQGYDQAGNSQFLNDLWKYDNCIANNLNISTSKPLLCKGETTTLTVHGIGLSTYTWTAFQHNVTYTVSPSSSKNYTLSTSDIYGCSYNLSYGQNVSQCTSITALTGSENGLLLYPNPSKGTVFLQANTDLQNLHLLIFNGLGEQVFVKNLESSAAEIKTNLNQGVYFYQLYQDKEKIQSGKLIIE